MVRAAILSVAFGLVVSVLIAWGAAIVTPAVAPAAAGNVTLYRLGVADDAPNVVIERSAFATRLTAMRFAPPDLRLPIHRDAALERALPDAGAVIVNRFGFPLHGLDHQVSLPFGRQVPALSWGWQFGDLLSGRVLPLRPRWSLLVNVLLWGPGPWLIVGHFRRRRRIRRLDAGGCGRCGYEQVAIGAVCPECGRENTDIRPAPDTLPPHLPTTAGAAVRGPSGGSGEEVRA